MATERLAPAKVNLFLHVGPLGDRGYHPICSLMVFADIGDRLKLAPSRRMAFGIAGPFAGELDSGEGNLVPRARDRLLDAVGGLPAAFRLTLDKQLPVASGLGGGSADAAATLNLVADALTTSGGGSPNQGQLEIIARELGADVAACLHSRSVIAEGRGDRLTPAPDMPPLDAVLANPGAPSSTRAVYHAFDEACGETRADRPDLPLSFRSASAVADFLRARRNDLEAPAVALQPLTGAALAALRGEPETLLARMSGSGATCFSLCASDLDARRLADRLAAARPTWWIRACRLGSAGAPRKG
jgi:4-diphosphocytidyl-2-C-methyl-D-erythritol kinase